jgi:extracellular matrix protein 14
MRADVSSDTPATKVLTRYGGDVVLRFQITGAQEAKALAEATSVLFLDVWEFTREWVDVRLAKETVSSISSVLSLQKALIPLGLGTISAWSSPTFSTTCSYSFDARSGSGDI